MPQVPHIDFKRRAPALGLVALYAYLAFHAFSGSQGLMSWISYTEEADQLTLTLVQKQSRREELQLNVEALRNEGLDLDALDIAARRDLFVSDTNEVTIWLDP